MSLRFGRRGVRHETSAHVALDLTGTAAEAYPELAEILVSRPPPEHHTAVVGGTSCSLCHLRPAEYTVGGSTVCGYCAHDRFGRTEIDPGGEESQFGDYTAALDKKIMVEAAYPSDGDPSSIAPEASLDDPDFRFHVTASWRDVQAKAKRIMKSGGVKITGSPGPAHPYITAEVQGDNGVYECTIMRTIGGKSVASWECSCPWAHYSWGRSGRWKKYEGRQCSHCLALVYQAQKDEMFGGEVKQIGHKPLWDTPVQRPGDYQPPPIGPWRIGAKEAAGTLMDPWRESADHIGRGILHNPSWDTAEKVYNNHPDAAHHLLRELNGGEGDEGVGRWWGQAGPHSYDKDEAHDYAMDDAGSEELHHKWRNDPDSERTKIPGQIEVTLLGKRPAHLDPSGSGHDQYEDFKGSGTHYLPGGTDVELHSIHVNDGRGWRELPGGRGLHVKAHVVAFGSEGNGTRFTDEIMHGQSPGFKARFKYLPNGYRLFDTMGTVIHAHAPNGDGTYSHAGALSWFGGKPRKLPDGSFDDRSNINGGMIHQIAVRPAHQRKGLATEMLNFARERYPNQEIRHSHALTDDGKAWSQTIAQLHADSDTGKPHTGVMIAIVPPKDILDDLHVEGGEDVAEMHVTVAYLGKTDDIDEDKLHSAVEAFSAVAPPLHATVGGFGQFDTPDEGEGRTKAHVALVDIPGIDRFRRMLMSFLTGVGISVTDTHGVIPHITLRYSGDNMELSDHTGGHQFEVDKVIVGYGGDWTDYSLKGEEDFTKAAAKDKLVAAGLVVKAEDTGRVLMLQRSNDDQDDPAAGKFEWPGGHIEDDESPAEAAIREWKEEVGCLLPPGRFADGWTSSNGVYQAFVYVIDHEDDLDLNLDHENREVPNPDMESRKYEVATWFDPKDLPEMPALRDECRSSDWKLIKSAKVYVPHDDKWMLPENADEAHYRLNAPGGSPVRGRPVHPDDPMIPDTVYHVTTNLPSVHKSKTLLAGGVGGLGGDKQDQIVSMTTDKTKAEHLEHDIKFMAGMYKKHGPDVHETWNEDTKKWEGGDAERGHRINQDFIDEGKKHGGFDYEGHVFAPHQFSGYALGDHANMFYSVRSHHTNMRNPLFYGDSLKHVNPDHVGTVHIPKANLKESGAMLTDLDHDNPTAGLSEIRAYGDVPVHNARFTQAGKDYVPADKKVESMLTAKQASLGWHFATYNEELDAITVAEEHQQQQHPNDVEIEQNPYKGPAFMGPVIGSIDPFQAPDWWNPEWGLLRQQMDERAKEDLQTPHHLPFPWEQDIEPWPHTSGLDDPFLLEADLHDEPEPALPTTDGTGEPAAEESPSDNWVRNHGPEAPNPGSAGPPDFGQPLDPNEYRENMGLRETDDKLLEPGSVNTDEDESKTEREFAALDSQASLRPAWLEPGGSGSTPIARQRAENRQIAQMAQRFLKEGMRAFSAEEQADLIGEGEADGTRAGNLASLDLTNTHYQAIEDSLQAAEAMDDAAVSMWD